MRGGKYPPYLGQIALARARPAPNAHAKGFWALGSPPPNRAVTDDQQHLPVQFRQMLRHVPYFLLRPPQSVLVTHAIWKIARQRQQQAYDVFAHGHGKDSTWVGHQNPRIPQFRVHQLRDSRGGRMNPLQLFSVSQLFRAQRIAHKYVGIWELRPQAFLIWHMHHAHLRPALPDGLGHCRLGPPFGEGVPYANNQLRFCWARPATQPHSSFSLRLQGYVMLSEAKHLNSSV